VRQRGIFFASENYRLRSLLAEARAEIAIFQPILEESDRETEQAVGIEYAFLLSRIDDALKGHEATK
jgi:hypothetical protein